MFTKAQWWYWDPPREVFVIPVLDHPIAWYGVLFAFGFVVAYFVLRGMLSEWLLGYPTFVQDHVTDWKGLVSKLKTKAAGFVLDKMKPEARKDFDAHKKSKEPDAALRKNILSSLNRSLRVSGLYEAKRFAKVALSGITRRYLRKEEKGLAVPVRERNRLLLEDLCTPALRTMRELATVLTDRLTWYIVLGTVIGARLGHVFFYGWEIYSARPLDILMIWKGGLASHGAVIGILIALLLFRKRIVMTYPSLTLLRLVDILAVPAGFIAACIRFGNFVNQEILGKATDVPWAVVFGHPADGSVAVPRHPVQLYEAAFYLLTFVFLFSLWKCKRHKLYPGFTVGLFFALIFGFRFLIEFLKVPQSPEFTEASALLMGQYLSIPFCLAGLFIMWWGYRNQDKTNI